MTTTDSEARTIRAPRGTEISCQSWQQEAALRMLMNNLDPEVAERPEQLIVYGGIGKAARNWECFDAIVATLKRLENDETLLVQSGKPVGVFKTHENAPRVLIANANLVPHWGTWDEFRRLDALGLTMYGQMTAGSWIYIGTQGILQGTYECFASVARTHFNNSLRGKLVVTAGLGGMGGAQPLAATMNEATALIAEVDRSRIQRRLDLRYLDVEEKSLDAAIDRALKARDAGEAISIGGVANAVEVGGFVPMFIRPLFCEGKGPFRWAALSGDPNDLYVTDEELLTLFHNDKSLHRWIRMAQKRVAFQGLPARICWLGYGERAKAGLLFNRLVAEKKVKAPIVIGRDHLDAGSVASPNRETEGMRDGSDAIADWPILNALLNTAAGESCRLVFSEGDMLPGLTVDRYGSCLAGIGRAHV